MAVQVTSGDDGSQNSRGAYPLREQEAADSASQGPADVQTSIDISPEDL
jgi:hypothetical protein